MQMDGALEIRAHRLMVESRCIDEVCKEHLAAGGSVPNYHSGIGQEAMSVGIGTAVGESDYLLFTYRDFGMLLAKGLTATDLFGDLLLNTAGTTGGHGGVMHISAPEHGVVGRNSVFGSRFGIAIGLGLAAKHRGQGQVVVCPFGEAEGGRGVLYEALNMAMLGSLPVIFVAENNGYSIASRTADLYATGDMTGLFSGDSVPTAKVDGNDLRLVHAATGEAVERARSGGGPSLLEFLTYRIDPHIPADTIYRYRTEEEIAPWRQRDPLVLHRAQLLSEGKADDAELAALETQVQASVRKAFDEARSAAGPTLESMYEYLYYPRGRWGRRTENAHA
jgi:acetoin:2,6-dichlorophenolindophenol oxidoreductase subunit alpha